MMYFTTTYIDTCTDMLVGRPPIDTNGILVMLIMNIKSKNNIKVSNDEMS